MFNIQDTPLVFIERDDVKGIMTFDRRCPFCKTVVRREFSIKSLQPDASPSELIQAVLPKLTPDEREFFMTGICTPCWNAL